MDLFRSGALDHPHQFANRCAAHDRIVDQHNALARKVAGQRVELLPDAFIAHCLPRLDEGPPHVVIAEKSHLEGHTLVLGVAEPNEIRRVGNGDHNQVIADRDVVVAGRQRAADLLPHIVDILAEDLHGEMAVYDYIRKENKSANGHRAFRTAKNCINPITRDELMNIAEVWVTAALRLESRDLRMMERLVARQSNLKQNTTPKHAAVNS